ncbi:MAG: SRPBCC family protein [Psychroflexus sp.]|jgi:carbon monoxide dehydrogenase subunit G|nr:SRPBCC family protein [Psychroflexus sp.]MDR9448461.1 SRPBCC family protein [Psychroflexus sp.]
MELKTDKTEVNQSQHAIFEFLTHSSNFEELMPSSIEKFEVVENEQFNFQLSGMPEIRLKPKAQTPSEQIVLTSASDKFSFDLEINILSIEDNKSQVYLKFAGQFNSMMAMMIKSPIEKFINKLVDNLQKRYDDR